MPSETTIPPISSGLVSIADEQNLLAFIGPFLSLVGGEHDPAAGGARRRVESLGEGFRRLENLWINHRVQKLIQVLGRHAEDRGILVDESFGHHVDGAFHRSGARALAGTRPEEGKALPAGP